MSYLPTIDAKRKWLIFKGQSASDDTATQWARHMKAAYAAGRDSIYDRANELMGTLGYTYGGAQMRWRRYLMERTAGTFDSIPDLEANYFNASFSMGTRDATSMSDSMGRVPVGFLRNLAASYVADSAGTVASAAINVHRCQYETIAGKTGVLFEAASQNLLQYTEDITNAVWTATSLTVTANAATAPNGTATADKIENASANVGNYAQSYALTTVTTTPWVFSLWMKADSAATYDIQIIDNLLGSVTSTVNVTTSWQRFTVSKSSLAGVTVTVRVYCGTGSTARGPAYVWGHQLESNAGAQYVSSYIANTATTLNTRPFDNSFVEIADVPYGFTNVRGTLLIEYTPQFTTSQISNANSPSLFWYKDNTNTFSSVKIRHQQNSGGIRIQIEDNAGAFHHAIHSTTMTAGRSYQIIAMWDSTAPVVNSGGDKYTAVYVRENSGSGYGAWSLNSSWLNSTAGWSVDALDYYILFYDSAAGSPRGTLHTMKVCDRVMSASEAQRFFR